MNHLCFTASWKSSANRERAGKDSKKRTTFSLNTHDESENSLPHACRVLPGGQGVRTRHEKINWSSSSWRKKNKASWCILGEMSFSHWPSGYLSQRWPVKVMWHSARWSVSLTLSRHNSIYWSKCCTFVCCSHINLTLLHRAGALKYQQLSAQSHTGEEVFVLTLPAKCWKLGIVSWEFSEVQRAIMFLWSASVRWG